MEVEMVRLASGSCVTDSSGGASCSTCLPLCQGEEEAFSVRPDLVESFGSQETLEYEL